MASRRDFFKKLAEPVIKDEQNLVVRPPYAKGIDFSACSSCEDKPCVSVCYEKIIKIDKEGLPFLDFSKSGCTFCEDCAKVCEKEVLSLEKGKELINAKFTISFESCMAHNNTICFSCKEPCIEDAILFNGMFNPVIDNDKCTGCGFCLSRCPTNAISYLATQLGG